MGEGKNCIFALNDTRLHKNTQLARIPGYTMIREDKDYNSIMATAGGVAFIIPQNWSCHRVNIRPIGDNCESLTVIITPIGEKPFKLNTMYNHPGHHVSSQFIKDLKNLQFNDKNLPLLILGDLNSPHQSFGSRTTNEYGKSLLQIINDENLILVNDIKEPTYYSNANGLENLIDLVICDNGMSRIISDCRVTGDVGSDHRPVCTTLNFRIRVNKRQNVNLKQWAANTDKQLSKFQKLDNINENIQAISNIFKTAKDESTFTSKSSRKNLPFEIRQLINQRRVLLKCKKKASTDLAKKVVTRQYNRINHLVQQKLKEHDQKALEKLASDICETENLGKMWKLFNRFKNKDETINEPETPLMRPCGKLTENSKEKCNEFARYLSSVHQTPENPAFDIGFKRTLDNLIENEPRITSSEITIDPITVIKLRQLLCSTKSGSAPGEDSITFDVLKECSDNSLQTICNLLNECLEQNVFPRSWKSAKLRMLLKPGKDATQAAGYRPISLISCVGKLFEKYINEFLLKELNEKKFFKPVQAGYTKGRSSQEHLFRLSQDVMNSFKARKCTAGLFLDVKAAFDCVWKNGLKQKIKQIGLSKQLENLLFDFLDERTLRVFENGCWSDIVNLEAGTPQGSILSPILYLIYMNDATDNLNGDEASLSQYADDIGTWASGETVEETLAKLQRVLNQLEKWCQKWFVTLNPLKSQLIVFTKCFRHKAEMESNTMTLRLFGHDIPIVTEAIFLGVIFDQRMTFEAQFKKTTTRAHKRLNLIRRISSLSKKPNPNILAELYKTIIVPIFEYSSICTINAADVHIEKLQLLQNTAMRTITNNPAYITINDLHDCTGFQPIKSHLISYAKLRLDTMRQNSTILEKSIHEFEQVRHIHENRSVLDILYQ